MYDSYANRSGILTVSEANFRQALAGVALQTTHQGQPEFDPVIFLDFQDLFSELPLKHHAFPLQASLFGGLLLFLPLLLDETLLFQLKLFIKFLLESQHILVSKPADSRIPVLKLGGAAGGEWCKRLWRTYFRWQLLAVLSDQLLCFELRRQNEPHLLDQSGVGEVIRIRCL